MILPDGDQYILDLKWAKKEQQFSILIPPITWLFGDNEPTPDDIKNVMQSELEIQLTLNGVEWNKIGKFTYYGNHIIVLIFTLFRSIDYEDITS